MKDIAYPFSTILKFPVIAYIQNVAIVSQNKIYMIRDVSLFPDYVF